jgi:PKD repeat protein
MTTGGALGIVGGAAGGATVAALAFMGDETTPESPDTGSPEAIRACFTPDPIPDIESGATLRFDASCTTPVTVSTYQWNFGDGSAGEGTSVEHLFRPGGVYSVTLTARDGQRADSISRLVRVLATPTACFTTIPNPPRIFVNDSISFNAECSMGDRDGGSSRITLYEWEFGDGRPGAEGRFVSRQFTRPDVYGVTLTVTNADGRQDRTTQFVVVERRASGGRLELSFVSHLELPEGASAQVSVNETDMIASVAGSPQQYRAGAREGENLFDGRLLAPARGPGRWHFDFTRTSGFVPGSIRVESGDVLAVETHRVVFRVDSDSTAPIRFRFRVEE